MKIKHSFMLCTLILLCGQNTQVQAATGYCTAKNGTNLFSVVISENLNNFQNKAGQSFDSKFGGLGTYAGDCECDSSDEANPPPVYYKAEYTPGLVKEDSGGYIRLNPYVDVAAFIHIANHPDDIQVPFKDLSNNRNNACDLTSFSTGADGHLTFKINKPFMGKVDIPAMSLASIYGTVRPGSYTADAMSTIQISGSIIVPQNCEINPDSIISIDFGKIPVRNIMTKGQKPDGFTEHRETIGYICNNIEDGVHIAMSFRAIPSTEINEAIATSNKDIGIIITDANSNIIPVNTGDLSMPLTDGANASQKGSVDILSYPINTTGNTPELGAFNATATIKLDIK